MVEQLLLWNNILRVEILATHAGLEVQVRAKGVIHIARITDQHTLSCQMTNALVSTGENHGD